MIRERNLMGSILALAVPVMLSNLLEIVYNLTDSFFLGRLGRVALTAPSIAGSITYLATVFGMAFTSAGLTLIAQARGRNEAAEAERCLGQVTLYSGFVSIVLSSVLVLNLDGILDLLGVPPDAEQAARQYMGIIFTGIPFMFLTSAFRTAMQGWGDSVTPLAIQGGSILLNIVLDPLFIFGFGPIPALGVRGAAYTTVFSQAMTVFFGYGFLLSGRGGPRLRLRNLKPDLAILAVFLKIGVPVSIGQGFTAMGFTVLSRLLNTFGSAVIAAAGTGDRIINFFIVPIFGLSTAVTSITGRYIGANRPGTARKAAELSLSAGGIIITAGMAVTFFTGEYLMRLFTDDPEVIEYGREFFRFVSPPVIFLAFSSIINGAFQGGGHTLPVMVLAIVRLWGIRIPVSYLLALAVWKDPVGIWMGSALSNILPAVAAFVLFARGGWLRRKKIPPIAYDIRQEDHHEP